MKNNSGMPILAALLALVCLTGCGAGNVAVDDPSRSHATSFMVKLGTTGTAATIYGIDMTVNLPGGVTLNSLPDTHETAPGVVAASGVGATGTVITAVYTAATGALPGTVRILALNIDGFAPGEFCTVYGSITTTQLPSTSDFAASDFMALDLNGDVLGGLVPIATELRFY